MQDGHRRQTNRVAHVVLFHARERSIAAPHSRRNSIERAGGKRRHAAERRHCFARIVVGRGGDEDRSGSARDVHTERKGVVPRLTIFRNVRDCPKHRPAFGAGGDAAQRDDALPKGCERSDVGGIQRGVVETKVKHTRRASRGAGGERHSHNHRVANKERVRRVEIGDGEVGNFALFEDERA